MRFLFIILGLFISSTCYCTEKYSLDPNHTNVTWHANHFGFSNPSGKFINSKGIINFDEKHPENSSLNATVYLNNLLTGIEKFDAHLKSKDFFNAKEFPIATFISKKIILTGKNSANVLGNLTMLGVTKPLVLHVKLNKLGINPISNKKTTGFTAHGIIKRSNFGMTYGLPGIADDVRIDIEAEGTANE